MVRRFMVPAYIRRNGEFVKFARFDVVAQTGSDALLMVQRHYRHMGLDAGINPESVFELEEFRELERSI